jgi:hypothetical protein
MAADAYQYPRLQAVDPLVGYVSRLDPDRYPGPDALAHLLDQVTDVTHVWIAGLVHIGRKGGVPVLLRSPRASAATIREPVPGRGPVRGIGGYREWPRAVLTFRPVVKDPLEHPESDTGNRHGFRVGSMPN